MIEDVFRFFAQRQAADTMFALAIVAVAYSLARMLNARQSVALAFAFTPLLGIWAWSNVATRHFILAQFF